MILAIFDLKITLILPIKFSVNWLSVLKKFKTDFQDGSHTGFLVKTNLAIFDLQVYKIFPTKFRVSCPFGSGEH